MRAVASKILDGLWRVVNEFGWLYRDDKGNPVDGIGYATEEEAKAKCDELNPKE